MGSQQLSDIRSAAVEAMHRSLSATWLLEDGHTYTVTELNQLCERARESALSRHRVEHSLAELVNEAVKTKQLHRWSEPLDENRDARSRGDEE